MSSKRRRIECELTYNEYIIELLMDKLKDMFATSDKRIILITQYLINKGTDISKFEVIPIYEQTSIKGETNNAKQTRINLELYTYIKTAISNYSDKKYIITGIRDIPNPETEETHFTGLIINTGTKKVYYFDTAGGEYYANDVTTVALKGLAKSLPGIRYTFVNETNTGATCQVVPHDTFCQTWSAYYTIGKVLNPRFGLELAKHARTTNHNNSMKIKRLFTVFKDLTTNLPPSILEGLANEYAAEVKYDPKVPRTLKSLSPRQIQLVFTRYFSNDENKESFIKLVEMPPIDECPRVLSENSVNSFRVMIRNGGRRYLNRTRKARR